MKILSQLESWNKSLIIFWGFILIAIIGVFDFLTGDEYAFSVFYVFPISMITWGTGQKNGYFACFASAVVWFWADVSTRNPYSNAFVPYWNTLIRFSFFVITVYLLFALKSALQREKWLSLTDHLTGASNSRRFYEIVQMEINRLERSQRPFTIAYLDVDNFKTINDTFGHLEGDLVLKTIVSTLRSNLRNTDLVARLGGDELALFFPDTNRESAEIILPKLQEALMNEMAKNNWTITFSVGVVTCKVAPIGANDLIKAADDLMYSIKRHGKNRIKYLEKKQKQARDS